MAFWTLLFLSSLLHQWENPHLYLSVTPSLHCSLFYWGCLRGREAEGLFYTHFEGGGVACILSPGSYTSGSLGASPLDLSTSEVVSMVLSPTLNGSEQALLGFFLGKWVFEWERQHQHRPVFPSSPSPLRVTLQESSHVPGLWRREGVLSTRAFVSQHCRSVFASPSPRRGRGGGGCWDNQYFLFSVLSLNCTSEFCETCYFIITAWLEYSRNLDKRL